ncbi:probable disease resistance protein At4g27220 [Aristolochia californica]|uniref:probable disease resistance protein At4g27220 n=1 Tax=Aristolochia californica TaxID=171875 RepID=UPI0035D8F189
MSVETADRLIDEKGNKRNPLSSKPKYTSFEQMKGVKALNLSRADIRSLPKSLSEMKNLRALILHGCTSLKKLPCLANLRELQVLDLSHTVIEELPPGTEELVNLRCLRLSHTPCLKVFRSGVLSNFLSLEELSMRESRWVWTSEAQGAQVDEIATLTNLSELELKLADWSDLVQCMSPEHRKDLKRFSLTVGFWGPVRTQGVGDNTVVVCGCDLTGAGRRLVLPDKTLQLVLQNCQLPESMSLSNMEQLKDCYMQRCHRMEWLTIVNDGETRPALPNLEKLEINWLPDVMSLYKGLVTPGTLANLKILTIRHCHKLMNLFSTELLKQLQSLEKISVSDCYMMEELVAGGDVGETVVLPKLKTFSLRYLSKLKTVFRGKLICESLESVEVDQCPVLKKLPLADNELPPMLKVILGSKKWWGGLEWDSPNANTVLLPLLHPLCDEEFEEEEEQSCINEEQKEETVWH